MVLCQAVVYIRAMHLASNFGNTFMSEAVAAGMFPRFAEPGNYGEMFTLQRAAYVDEDSLYQTLDISAFNESFKQFVEQLMRFKSWVAVDKGRIVAAVAL